MQDLVKALPAQGKFNNPERPVAAKLGVDPYLRVVGARDMIALGDCSMMVGERLPATAQVRLLGSWECAIAAACGPYFAHRFLAGASHMCTFVWFCRWLRSRARTWRA